MKNKTKVFLAGAMCTGGIWCSYHENHTLYCESILYQNKKVPNAFHGCRILHISDLHNTSFGHYQKKLLKEIQFAHADIIVITGDLIDGARSKETNLRPMKALIQEIVRMAPVYYVPGNHEANSPIYLTLVAYLRKQGVKILDNRIAYLSKDDDTMAIVGVKDPYFYEDSSSQFARTLVELRKAVKDDFTILLSHRPEYFPWYEACGYHLIFSGHAHGGQIGIGHRQGLFSPHQGWKPTYCDGLYHGKDSVLVVSRGLGNSKFPLRIHNHPHLITVVLSHG